MRLDRQRVCHSARPTAAKVACRAPRLQRTPITATPPSPSQQTNMHYLRRRRLVVLVQGVAKLRLHRFLDSKGTRLVGLVRAGRLGQLAAPSPSSAPLVMSPLHVQLGLHRQTPAFFAKQAGATQVILPHELDFLPQVLHGPRDCLGCVGMARCKANTSDGCAPPLASVSVPTPCAASSSRLRSVARPPFSRMPPLT